MNVVHILMSDDDILEFKKNIQYAFQKGFEDVYGKTNDFRPQNCIETVEMNEYGRLEIIYTDKAFSWAVYFSH